MEEKISKQNIDRLNISDNYIKILKNNNVITIGKLCKKIKNDLRKLDIVQFDIKKIETELQLLGLNLKNSLWLLEKMASISQNNHQIGIIFIALRHYNNIVRWLKVSIFDKYLFKKDRLIKRRIEIDSTLYEKLVELSNEYDASINKLVNIAIIEMIKTENVKVYEKPENEIVEAHNFAIRETSYNEMEKLKNKYGLSIYKLTNIAIYNAVNS